MMKATRLKVSYNLQIVQGVGLPFKAENLESYTLPWLTLYSHVIPLLIDRVVSK